MSKKEIRDLLEKALNSFSQYERDDLIKYIIALLDEQQDKPYPTCQQKPEQTDLGNFIREIKTSIQRYRIGQVDIAADWAIDKLTEALIFCDRLEVAEAKFQTEYEVTERFMRERKKITKALNLKGILGEDIASISYILTAIQQQAEQINELKKYLRHMDECKSHKYDPEHPKWECTCGLQKALKE